MTHEEVEKLRQRFVGKLVFVVIADPIHHLAERGIVTEVDDMGQLHGTWGGLAAVPGEDFIEML